MSLVSWFKGLNKPRAVVRFKSYIGDFSVATPVVAARSIRPQWFKKQIVERKPQTMANCPGMFDFAQAGFLICAHADIHIKANAAGVVTMITSLPYLSAGEYDLLKPRKFDFSIVDGLAPIADGVKKTAEKIPLPWAIFLEPGWSVYLLPAVMHSPFLDKLHVYSGIIDGDEFHTCNFVFSALKECEVIIPAGTPLLQAIPVARIDVIAECGKATESERDKQLFNMPSRVKGYYRKFKHAKKVHRMACPMHSEEKK